jgi:allophanate hydrolase subunit 2
MSDPGLTPFAGRSPVSPILLLAEGATTAGHATIAKGITADLAIASQLAPGYWIAFEAVTHAHPLDALRAREADLTGVKPGSDQGQTCV